MAYGRKIKTEVKGTSGRWEYREILKSWSRRLRRKTDKRICREELKEHRQQKGKEE